MYGLSAESSGKAAILYPTLADDAREQRIELRDPVNANRCGEIALRPVNLNRLQTLLESKHKLSAQHEMKADARWLAFGSSPA